MKIGYPCINRTIGCTANHTFRLGSYSEQKLIETTAKNLSCLKKILAFNVENGLFFFRIGSGLIPFASHPVCKYDWADHFKEKFLELGRFIKKHKLRISMHPDQFVLINSPREDVVKKSILELEYHGKILDLMNLSQSAKMQIHIGGVYQDKKASLKRFTKNYSQLSLAVKKRLVIENDDRHYSLRDCVQIHESTGVPILFDSFHHECFNRHESLPEALFAAQKTWQRLDGCLMIDYSEQDNQKRRGAHAETIDLVKFKKFVAQLQGIDADIMLEIKDKEKSALEALAQLK